MEQFPTWGDKHYVAVDHPIGLIPWAGENLFSDYQLKRFPVSGSVDTIMKTAHDFSLGPQRAFYGSNSRYISLMHDIDESYFLLLGGQDGWLRSSTNVDQVPMWQKGDYIRFPLRPESIRKSFPTHFELRPKAPSS